MGRRRYRARWTWLGAIVCGLIAALPFVGLFGRGTYPIERDLLVYVAPIRAVAREAWADGHFPLWDTYQQFGQSVAGNPSFVFSPLFWPGIVGGWTGFRLSIVVQYFLLGVGAFTLLGLGLRCRPWPAVLGGLVIAGSGYLFSVYFQFYFQSAPWLLFYAGCWARSCRHWSPGYAALAGVSLGLAVLAGQWQEVSLWFLVVTAATVVFLWQREQGHLRFARTAARHVAATAVVTGLITLALTAANLLLVAQTQALSVRSTALPRADVVTWSLHPWRLIELILPYPWGVPEAGAPYVGDQLFAAPGAGGLGEWADLITLGGLTWFLLGLRVHRCRRRLAWCGWVLAGGALLMALGRHTPAFGLVLDLVPWLGRFRFPEKYLLFVVIAVGGLVALKTEALARDWRRPGFWVRLNAWPLAAGVATIVILELAGWRHLPPEIRSWNLTGLVFLLALGVGLNVVVAWGRRRAGTVAITWVLLFIAVGLAADSLRARLAKCVAVRAADPDDPANAPAALAIKADPGYSLYRVCCQVTQVVSGSLPAHDLPARALFPARALGMGLPALYGLRTHDGIYALESRRTRQFKELQRSPALLRRYLTLGALRYLVVPVADGQRPAVYEFGGELCPLLYYDPDYRLAVFVYPKALPRMRLLTTWTPVRDPTAAAAWLREAPEADLLQGAAVETSQAPPGAVPNGEPPRCRFRVVQERSGRVEVEIETTIPALFHYGDSYAPNWHARLDGAPAAVVPVNVNFMGVLIPPGRHRLELTYGWW